MYEPPLRRYKHSFGAKLGYYEQLLNFLYQPYRKPTHIQKKNISTLAEIFIAKYLHFFSGGFKDCMPNGGFIGVL